MITTFLILLFFFFSGFARVSYTKIGGIQIFVIIALIYLVYAYLVQPKSKNNVLNTSEHGIISYKKFIIWSIPALLIGLYYDKSDALYFYVYSLLPYLLYQKTKNLEIDIRTCLYAAEISVLIVIALGWAIYFGVLPIDFLYKDVTEAEYGLGYWGISYLASSRNHDYMYPLACTAISLFLFKNGKSSISKILQLVIFGVCELTLLASLARGGMIASFVYICLMYISLKKQDRLKFFGCVLVVLIIFGSVFQSLFESTFENIFLSIFGITKQTSYGGNFSNDIRKVIYWDAISSAAVNPIGYGIQNFSITSKIGGGSAENAYLTLLVERGWLATYFFIKFLWKQWKDIKEVPNRKDCLNFYLVPSIAIYFLFNYEFTSYMCVFVFFLMMIGGKSLNNKKI